MPNFTFSTSPSGAPIKHPVDMGTISNTGGTSVVPIYVKHDHSNKLSNVGMYIQPFTGTSYVGLYGQNQDYLKVLEWGQTANKGLLINVDAANTSALEDKQVKVGTGDAPSHAIPFETSMFNAGDSTAQGDFPVNKEAHFTLKLSIPSTELDAGVGTISQFLKFDL